MSAASHQLLKRIESRFQFQSVFNCDGELDSLELDSVELDSVELDSIGRRFLLFGFGFFFLGLLEATSAETCG